MLLSIATDLFAKFRAFLYASFLTHVYPLEGVRDFFKNDLMRTFFLSE
jgi:hypothetical protein